MPLSVIQKWLGTRGGRRPRYAVGEPLEKLVQMELERLDGFLEHEQHDAMKRQFALARKGAARGAMARQKAGLGKPGADGFDDANCRDIGWHPHAEMKSRGQCTYKTARGTYH